MSRLDKRRLQEEMLQTEASATGARLFVFSNHPKSYPVEFSPTAPIFLLKSKKTNEQHPAAQWAQFAQLLFARDPHRPGQVYVVDTTSLGPQAETDEDASPLLLGTALKQAGKVITRINGKAGVIVAAGVSAIYALKSALLSDRKTNSRGEPLVQTVVLVCPRKSDLFKELVLYAIRHRQRLGLDAQLTGHLQLIVLQQGEDLVKDWRQFCTLEEVRQLFGGGLHVETRLSPSLFHGLANVLVPEPVDEPLAASDDGDEGYPQRLSVPRLYRIQFFLSRFTKQVEQEVNESSVDDWGTATASSTTVTVSSASPPTAVTATAATSDSDDMVIVQGGAATVSGSLSLSEIFHVTSQDLFVIDVFVVDASKFLVGTAHGTATLYVDGEGEGAGPSSDPPPAAAADDGEEEPEFVVSRSVKKATKSLFSTLPNGSAFQTTVRVERTAEGHTVLVAAWEQASRIRLLTRTDIDQSEGLPSTVAEVPTSFALSTIEQSFGVVIIRGRKCVLVRSLSGAFRGMRAPFATHRSGSESAMECAIRAGCTQCDISEDTFFVHPSIAPVSYYPSPTHCVTLYCAFATALPVNAVEQDQQPDELDLREAYDWLTFDVALQSLSTVVERQALQDLQRNLQRAYVARFYQPPTGLGMFGEEPSLSTTKGPRMTMIGTRDKQQLQQQGVAVQAAYQRRRVVFYHATCVPPSSSTVSELLRTVVGPCADSCLSLSLLHAADSETVASQLQEWIDTPPSGSAPTICAVQIAVDRVDEARAFFESLTDILPEEKCSNFFASLIHLPTFLTTLAAFPKSSSSSPSSWDRLRFLSIADGALLVNYNYETASAAEEEVVGLLRSLVTSQLWDRLVKGGEDTLFFVTKVVPDVTFLPLDVPLSRATLPSRSMPCFRLPNGDHIVCVRYQRPARPFNPEALHALFHHEDASTLSTPSSTAWAALRPQVLWVGGYCWLSTRFAYRCLVAPVWSSPSSSSSDSSLALRLSLREGDPWWCTVEEADRPAAADPSKWDPRHGDRGHDLFWIVRCATSTEGQDDVTRQVCSMLDELLCAPEEWRTWQRKADRIPME